MSGGTGNTLVLNLARPAGSQSYFQTYHKREREDGAAPPLKRHKAAHKITPKQTAAKVTLEKKSEGREPDHSPEPSLEDEKGPLSEEKREIITSLFFGNPAIPYIPKSNVTRLSEKVFSEEAFSSLDLAPQIVSNLEKLGLTSMTTVQQQAVPSILAGRDALVKSQTGSGKTLTYALPILHSLMMQVPRVQRSDGVLALVVVPTRELALQSYQWFERLHKACVWVVPGYLIGGEKKKAEKARLRRGINILVGTPGRLIDHLHSTKSLTLAAVKFLIIDEADRLLDMGYERSITSIIETLQEQQPGLERKRQTVMLSATLSAGVEKLAGMSLQDPKVVDVSCSVGEGGSEERQLLLSEALATPANLCHYYLIVPAKLRLVTLAAFILSKCKFGDERKMIIFFATQDMVDYHTALFSEVLSRYGREVDNRTSLYKRAEKVLAGEEDEGQGSHDEEDVEKDEEEVEEDKERNKDTILFQKLHGNMTQQDRSAVFKSFKSASAGVLMCTDVASRGLDMPKVRWIVQFNAASTAADYVHRVGRTARVNAPGSALAFLAPAETSYIHMLERHKITMKELSMNELLRYLVLPQDHGKGKVASTVEEAATSLQVKVEKLLLQDRDLHDLARKAYVSFVRSYASYPKEVREMFNFKALHLGHYAKSMGLRDAPATLGAAAAFRAKREMKERKEKKEKKRKIQVMNQRCGKLPKTAGMSEFDSGLDSLPKTKTKKKAKTKTKPKLKR